MVWTSEAMSNPRIVVMALAAIMRLYTVLLASLACTSIMVRTSEAMSNPRIVVMALADIMRRGGDDHAHKELHPLYTPSMRRRGQRVITRARTKPRPLARASQPSTPGWPESRL